MMNLWCPKQAKSYEKHTFLYQASPLPTTETKAQFHGTTIIAPWPWKARTLFEPESINLFLFVRKNKASIKLWKCLSQRVALCLLIFPLLTFLFRRPGSQNLQKYLRKTFLFWFKNFWRKALKMKLSLSLLAGKRNQWTSYLRFKNRLCPCKRHKNWKVGQIWSRSYAWNFACFHRSWRQLCRLSTQYHGSHVPHCCLHKGSVDSFLLSLEKPLYNL